MIIGRAGISIFLLGAVLLLTSCKSSEELAVGVEEVEPVEYSPFYSINGSLEKDPEIEGWLEPFRGIYRRQMGRILAVAEAPLGFGKPESPLGNLVADIVRYRAAHEMQAYVHLALIDREGLHIEFEEGVITVGDLHEFAPHEHTLVILELDGERVAELADEIASRGGAPVSGMRMTISGGRATGVLVNAETVDPQRTYYLATRSDFTDIESGFESLKGYSARHDYPLLIRDMYIEYMRNRSVLTPATDLRIRER